MTRRPIKTRDTSFAKTCAQKLAKAGIRPNTISQSSLVFALLGFGFFYLATLSPLWLLVAILMIQARLLANLFDGMVAVEENQKEATGGFWNEFPDRPADVLLLWGAGIAAGLPTLGLLAAMLAVMCAYTRSLGTELTAEQNYQGPMAKQHRMFTLCLGALIGAFSGASWMPWVMGLTLGVICVGTMVTIVNRARHTLTAMKAKA